MLNMSTLLSDVFDRRAEGRLELGEERTAIAAAQLGDDDATAKLILAYAPALRNGVTWYTRALAGSPQPADLEDVRSQAILGLLEAIKAFDGTTHERLAATVASYIRNAVTTSAASVTSFTVPERTLKRFFGILRTAEGNVYEGARIAPDYEMKTETFLAVLSAVRNVESYDAILDGNAGGFDGTTSERFNTGVERGVEARPLWDGREADAEDRILVEAAFTAVNTLEADVVRLAYGFSDYEPVPDAEIGARMGFSRATTQRTRTGALDKMRRVLGVVE